MPSAKRIIGRLTPAARAATMSFAALARPAVTLSSLALPLVTLSLTALAPSASAAPAPVQDKALGATRDQKKSLAPLLDVIVDQLDLLTVHGDERTLRRLVTNALEVQVTWKAMARYDEVLLKIIADDLGIKTSDGLMTVRNSLLPSYLASPTAEEMALLVPSLPEYPEFGSEAERQEYERERERLRRNVKQAELRARSLIYPAVDIKEMHLRCVRHEKLALTELRQRAPQELERSAQKALRTVAEHHAPRLAAALGVEPDREFRELVQAGLDHPTSEEAMLGVLVKLRAAVRPQVYEEEQVEDDPLLICDAHPKVIARVCKGVAESGCWAELRADFEAVLEDPRAATKAIKARGE